jgi:hypothetical protein
MRWARVTSGKGATLARAELTVAKKAASKAITLGEIRELVAEAAMALLPGGIMRQGLCA